MAFPPEWAANIVSLCSEFPNHPQRILISWEFHRCVDTSLETPLSCLMPPVLLWSPQEQFQFLMLNCPRCTSHSRLHPRGWRDGTAERLLPKRIQGMYAIVLLVERLYLCEHGHEILSYDPGVLVQFPTPSMIPFRL